MIDNKLIILASVLIWFFIVLPLLFVSPGAAVTIWIIDIFILVWGYVGWKKQAQEIEIARRAAIDEKARERVRQQAQLEEEGRLRARQSYPNQQVVKETVITREVLIQCRNCGARYQQGTLRCLTCGANL